MFVSSIRNKKSLLMVSACIVVAGIITLIQTQIVEPSMRWALAVFFQWSLVIPLAYLLGKYALKLIRQLGLGRRDIKMLCAVYAVALGAGLLFLYLFFAQEQDIKVYDSTLFWIRVLEGRDRAANSIIEYLRTLRITLSHEYSDLAALPLLPFSHLFGTQFTGYCQAIYTVYYLPACLFMGLVATRLVASARGSAPGISSLIVCFLICALCPPLMWPLILGYVDVAGVLIVAVLLNYALDWDGLRFSMKDNLILAALSVTLVLTRRWYAYYVVGFYAVTGVLTVLRLLFTRSFTPRKFGTLALNMLTIAGIACLSMYLLNPAIFELFLGTDYSVAYEAFKAHSIWQSLYYLFCHIGLFWLALGLVGGIWLIQTRASRVSSLRVLLAGFAAGLFFLSVQDMGAHHQYLLLSTLPIFIAAFASLLLVKVSKTNAPVLISALLLGSVINFAFVFTPGLAASSSYTQPLTSELTNYPKRLTNYDEYHEIYEDISARAEGTEHFVYVVGEGAVMNPEYFRRIELPESTDAAPFVLTNNTADLRDGFPSQLFMADYVLMVDPYSTEFSSIQQVSFQVYDLFLNEPALREYYQLEKTYDLAEHKALLYKKTRPMDRRCVDLLKARLMEHYPDTPFVYEPNYFLSLLESRGLQSFNHWDHSLTAMKKAEESFELTVRDTASFSALSLELECWDAELELVVSGQSGEIYRASIEPGRAAHRFEIQNSDFLTIALMDSGAEASKDVIFYIRYHADSLN